LRESNAPVSQGNGNVSSEGARVYLGDFGKIDLPKKSPIVLSYNKEKDIYRVGGLDFRNEIYISTENGRKSINKVLRIKKMHKAGGFLLVEGSTGFSNSSNKHLLLVRISDGKSAIIKALSEKVSFEGISLNSESRLDFYPAKKRVRSVISSGKGDLYFVTGGKLIELKIGDSDEVVIKQVTPDSFIVSSFAVDRSGNILIDTLIKQGSVEKSVWLLTMNGELYPWESFSSYLAMSPKGEFIFYGKGNYYIYREEKLVLYCSANILVEEKRCHKVVAGSSLNSWDWFNYLDSAFIVLHDSVLENSIVEVINASKDYKQRIFSVPDYKRSFWDKSSKYLYFQKNDKSFFRVILPTEAHRSNALKVVPISFNDDLLVNTWWVGQNDILYFTGIEKSTGDDVFGHMDLRFTVDPVVSIYGRNERLKIIDVITLE
jgi:hypothetical protein